MPRKPVHKISVADVEYIAFRLAQELMGWDEPIPDFNTRFPHRLESCVGLPFQKFARRQLYAGIEGKAAILFYLMIKNHPFQNGNKRIAVATVLYFLHLHGRWLQVDSQELYNFAKWVASSNPKVKDETIKAIQGFIKSSQVTNHKDTH